MVCYISAGLDEKYAIDHPECLARDRNEQIRRTRDFMTPGYHLICFNSPYLNMLADEVREMCANYDVKGVFLDIVKPTKCYCRNCAKLMAEQGLDMMNARDVQFMADKTYVKYTRAMREAVDSVKPGLPIFHNGGRTPRGQRVNSTYDLNKISSLQAFQAHYSSYDLNSNSKLFNLKFKLKYYLSYNSNKNMIQLIIQIKVLTFCYGGRPFLYRISYRTDLTVCAVFFFCFLCSEKFFELFF